MYFPESCEKYIYKHITQVPLETAEWVPHGAPGRRLGRPLGLGLGDSNLRPFLMEEVSNQPLVQWKVLDTFNEKNDSNTLQSTFQ